MVSSDGASVLKELWHLRRAPGALTVAKLNACPTLIRPYWARADLALDPLSAMLREHLESSDEKLRMAARVLLVDEPSLEKKFEALAVVEHCDPRTVKRRSDEGFLVLAEILEAATSLITSITGMIGVWLEGSTVTLEVGYRLRPPFTAKAPRLSFDEGDKAQDLELDVVELPDSVMVSSRVELDLSSVRQNEITVLPPYDAPCALHVRSHVDPDRLEVAFYVTEGTCHISLLNREISMDQIAREFAETIPEEYKGLLAEDFFDWSTDSDEDVRPSWPRIAPPQSE